MKYLRQNPTNSADDSKGHSLGLEGDQFLYIIGGLVTGIVLLLICMKSGMSPGMSLFFAIIPLPICGAFLVIFKIGKPPRYPRDLIQKWLNKSSLTHGQSQENPYLKLKSELKETP